MAGWPTKRRRTSDFESSDLLLSTSETLALLNIVKGHQETLIKLLATEKHGEDKRNKYASTLAETFNVITVLANAYLYKVAQDDVAGCFADTL